MVFSKFIQCFRSKIVAHCIHKHSRKKKPIRTQQNVENLMQWTNYEKKGIFHSRVLTPIEVSFKFSSFQLNINFQFSNERKMPKLFFPVFPYFSRLGNKELGDAFFNPFRSFDSWSSRELDKFTVSSRSVCSKLFNSIQADRFWMCNG